MRVLIAVEDKVYGQAMADFVGTHKWEKGTVFKVMHITHAEELGYVHGDACCCEVARNIMEERDRQARSLVKVIAAQIEMKLPGADVHEEIVLGSPKNTILETAEEWKADIIVMGSHGRTGLSRFLLGSVAMSVLSEARCSVMIIKLPHEQKQKHENEKAAFDRKKDDKSSRKAVCAN